ncbi:transmembrane protein 134 isoform X1 [Phyllostomus discolor]|uniref:Transmembrane protein 134 isoform X1 n=1 Tax=Phyllostomus discolor TaxID=89673 RepID=A0A7E6E317_9CHIR|nr:transmembrane protein 134 isoform X1 [Phyllostomus discolor]
MSATRPQFSIDDAFELSLEDAGPGPESSGVARFGPLHFERRARFEVADEDKQSRLRYQNLENDEDGAPASPEPDGGVGTRDSGRTSVRSSQWSFSTISSSTQRSYNACCSADCGRRGTGGGPLTRCLQRHLLRARLPVAGPRSLPRDLHLLCGQGPPGFPVLLPALLREVSPLQTPIDHRPQGSAWAPGSLLSSPGGAPRPARATPVPSSRWKSPFCRTPGAPAPSRVSSGSLGRTLSLGPGKSPLARSVP